MADSTQEPLSKTRRSKTYAEMTPEKREKRQAYLKEYQRNNADKFKSATKRYFKKLEDAKEYRAKLYRESTKQHQMIQCGCGITVKHHSMNAHMKSKRHVAAMEEKKLEAFATSIDDFTP